MSEIVEDVTEPLPNGAKLPDHPESTTGLKVVKYGKVWDMDGTPMKMGLKEPEIRLLQMGEPTALGHLYLYAIRSDRIFHTRDKVVIDVQCQPT